MAKRSNFNSRRLALHKILLKILGSENAYFQPPESKRLEFPCILYAVNNINNMHADNKPYISTKRYKLTFMTTSPESETCAKIEALPMCSYDTHYTANGIHHYVYNIYY